MRIIENSYKIGQRVGVHNYDNRLQILEGWVTGIDLEKKRCGSSYELNYTIADDKEMKWLNDGYKEWDLTDESEINS